MTEGSLRPDENSQRSGRCAAVPALGLKAAILVLIVLLQIAAAQADNLLDRATGSRLDQSQEDDGGSLLQRVAFVTAHRQDPVYRLPAECYSSCTLLLGIQGACVEPGSHLYFHSASVDGRRSPGWSAYAEKFYPQAIRHWIDAHGALSKLGFTTLDWRSAERLGVRLCQ
jgi:hypothetical protein